MALRQLLMCCSKYPSTPRLRSDLLARVKEDNYFSVSAILMKHLLFEEIRKFHYWAQTYSDIPEDERGGEWECAYNDWRSIRHLFDDFLNTSEPSHWNDEAIKELLYIIARDNESESLSDTLGKYPEALRTLATSVITYGPRDAKWQLATQLKELDDKTQAEQLLVKLVQDDEEYVSRKSLMTLADIGSSKTEFYCKLAWDKEIREQEYHRMAVLYSLDTIKSPLLSHYLKLAKQDGREHLLHNANLIGKNLSARKTNDR